MKTIKETQHSHFRICYLARKIAEAFGTKKNLVLKQYETSLEVWFYSTRIVKIDIETNNVHLLNGGYETKTTKNHLNTVLEVLHIPIYFYQKQFQWYLGEEEFKKEAIVTLN